MTKYTLEQLRTWRTNRLCSLFLNRELLSPESVESDESKQLCDLYVLTDILRERPLEEKIIPLQSLSKEYTTLIRQSNLRSSFELDERIKTLERVILNYVMIIISEERP